MLETRLDGRRALSRTPNQTSRRDQQAPRIAAENTPLISVKTLAHRQYSTKQAVACAVGRVPTAGTQRTTPVSALCGW
jgi:hypothetical protein